MRVYILCGSVMVSAGCPKNSAYTPALWLGTWSGRMAAIYPLRNFFRKLRMPPVSMGNSSARKRCRTDLTIGSSAAIFGGSYNALSW